MDSRAPVWVMVLWTAQAAPAVMLLVAGVASAGEAQPWKTAAAIGISVLWLATTLGVAGSKRGRAWLAAHRLQLVLAGASVVFATVVLDAALTVTGIVPTLQQQRSQSVSYSLDRWPRTRLVPQDVTVAGETIRINARGLRGAPIPEERPAGERRVLVLGGSQVFDSLGDWPGRLETSLRASGHDVRVLNAGVPGHDSFDSVEKLVADLWTLRPDVVVFCQTWNDVKYFARLTEHEPLKGLPPSAPSWWQPDGRLYPSGLDRVLAVSAIYRNFRWAWARRLYGEEGRRVTREPARMSPKEIARSHGLMQFRLNVEVVAQVTELINAELVLCKQAKLLSGDGSGDRQEFARDYVIRNTRLTPETVVDAYDACHQVIADVGERQGAIVVDMDREMTGNGDYFADGVHFNESGARFAAELMGEAIVSLPAPAAPTEDR